MESPERAPTPHEYPYIVAAEKRRHEAANGSGDPVRVLVEVGLGGRLDSTNVIMPEATVITSIDLDHTKLLGNTVEEIARGWMRSLPNTSPSP